MNDDVNVFDIKICVKCKKEMEVPPVRPAEVDCPHCGQRHMFLEKPKDGKRPPWWPFGKGGEKWKE